VIPQPGSLCLHIAPCIISDICAFGLLFQYGQGNCHSMTGKVGKKSSNFATEDL